MTEYDSIYCYPCPIEYNCFNEFKMVKVIGKINGFVTILSDRNKDVFLFIIIIILLFILLK